MLAMFVYRLNATMSEKKKKKKKRTRTRTLREIWYLEVLLQFAFPLQILLNLYKNDY
jgi:hypothetical protein